MAKNQNVRGDKDFQCRPNNINSPLINHVIESCFFRQVAYNILRVIKSLVPTAVTHKLAYPSAPIRTQRCPVNRTAIVRSQMSTRTRNFVDTRLAHAIHLSILCQHGSQLLIIEPIPAYIPATSCSTDLRTTNHIIGYYIISA